MAGRDMTLQVVVKLRDMLSSGLDATLRKITQWGSRAKAAFDRVGAGLGALSAKFGALGLGMSGGFAAGMQSLIAFDKTLRATVVNLDKSGAAAEAWIKAESRRWEGLVAKTGQVSADLAASQNQLVAALGPDKEPAATAMVPQIGKVATASSAAMADLTKTAQALFQSWEIGPERMETGLAKLFEAGRQGSFELKAMATYLPEIASLMASVGSKDMRAVAVGGALLQVSKMGAGTEEAAATNYKNFLSKVTAPDFKKNMREARVDIDAVLKDAAAKNIDPIEAVLGKIIKVTGADKEANKAAAEAAKKGLSPGDTQKLVADRVAKAIEGSKVGEILPDMQAKTFIATYLAHREEYKQIRDAIAKADATGVQGAFDTQMAGPEVKQRLAAEEIEQLGRRVAQPLTDLFDKVAWAAEKLQGFIAALDQISPKIVDAVVQVGAFVGALSGAIFTLQLLSKIAPAAVAPVAATGAGVGAAAVTAGAGSTGILGGVLGGRGAALLRLFARAGPLGALALISEALQAGIPATKEGMAYRLDAGPIDFADYERSRRAQIEWRRDPEGARGRAMMRRDERAAAPAQPPQKVEVGGSVTIRVEGPGVVTSTTSTNPAVPIGADRGATVGRP
jgi:hypothetical protein